VARIQTGAEGAVVTFEGTVRNNTKGRPTLCLDYDCYEPMALKMMAQIGREIAASHPVTRIAMVHRLGRMLVGETSVAVIVAAPHRKPAFDAAPQAKLGVVDGYRAAPPSVSPREVAHADRAFRDDGAAILELVRRSLSKESSRSRDGGFSGKGSRHLGEHARRYRCFRRADAGHAGLREALQMKTDDRARYGFTSRPPRGEAGRVGRSFTQHWVALARLAPSRSKSPSRGSVGPPRRDVLRSRQRIRARWRAEKNVCSRPFLDASHSMSKHGLSNGDI